jgi:hypothetical protein
MKKNKIIKWIVVFTLTGIVVAGAIIYYLFNMPHRDVQNAKTDYSFSSSAIVNEYLNDAVYANQKYLDEEGDSKIFEVSGLVADISENFNGQKVILLKEEDDKAGVSCTISSENETSASVVKIQDRIKVKGVIRSGANYDADLDMYENVIMEKCKNVK